MQAIPGAPAETWEGDDPRRLRPLWIQRTSQLSPAQIAHLHSWEITIYLLFQGTIFWGEVGRGVSRSEAN